jgi:UDP-glucose:(heptosyl)LPS alpha-1,3-glucosyltransferase
MKIAVVIPRYGLVGGAENFAFELCERLAEREDFTIEVFANKWRSGSPPIRFHKVPIITFPRSLRQMSFAFFSNTMIGRHRGFDLIHSHDRIFRMDLLTMHGIPHETWIKEARCKRLSLSDRSVAWIEKKGLTGSRMPVVVAVSNLVKDELLNLYNIPESKIHVVHPGISASRFSSLDPDECRNQIRRHHDLSPQDIVLLFASMNFEIKRLDLVLKSVADVVVKEDGISNLKLLVVGKGKREKYMTLARELGITNNIIFAGVTNEIEKYYLAADILAMPSRFDTFGLVVLEAMMAGLPVIISRRVGARDLVDSGVQGFVLAEEPSVSDMSEKLRFLMDRENRKKMGESARQVALRHTWEKTADQMADLYYQTAFGDN